MIRMCIMINSIHICMTTILIIINSTTYIIIIISSSSSSSSSYFVLSKPYSIVIGTTNSTNDIMILISSFPG